MRGGLGYQPTFIHFLVSSTRHKSCLLKNHILRLLNKIHPNLSDASLSVPCYLSTSSTDPFLPLVFSPLQPLTSPHLCSLLPCFLMLPRL